MLGPSLVVPAWTGLGVRVQGSIAVRFEPHPYTQTTWEHGLGPLKARPLRSQEVIEPFPKVSWEEETSWVPLAPKRTEQDPGCKPQDSCLLHKSPSCQKTCKQQPPSGEMTLLVTSNPGIV